MSSESLERFQKNLIVKRKAINDWLQATPADKRQTSLGPADEADVQEHLAVIDAAIEKCACETLDVCSVCHEKMDADLLEMDFTADVCLAHFSDAELRQLETELELSRNVQRALLPQQLPSISGLELAVFSRPAQILGGDFFDFAKFKDGAHGMAIADVMGHGMSAALVMASVQTALRTFIPQSAAPGEVARRMNHFFLHNIHLTTFFTMVLARIDSAARAIEFCNAGHNPPLLLQAHAGERPEAIWLRPTGAAVGLAESFTIHTQSVTLAPGDVLLLYTDGVTEAIDPHGAEFGTQRLETLLRENAVLNAREIVRALRVGLVEFTAGQPLFDDTTLLACKVTA